PVGAAGPTGGTGGTGPPGPPGPNGTWYASGTSAGTMAEGNDSRITGAVEQDGAKRTGKPVPPPDTTTHASLNVPPGATPNTPVDGDIWTTTASIFARLSGTSHTMYHNGNLVLPSQVEAEAGTATTERVWSAQRVKQAIEALTPESPVGLYTGSTQDETDF